MAVGQDIHSLMFIEHIIYARHWGYRYEQDNPCSDLYKAHILLVEM